MADELSAELELSISGALSAVDDLRSEIESQLLSATGEFSSAMADAVTSVPPIEVEADVDAVAPAIEGAITAVDPTVTVEADTLDAAAEIAAVAEDITAELLVEADTADAAAEIADVGENITAEVLVDADVAPAVTAIDDVVSGDHEVELGVSLDTSDAQSAVTALGDASSGATSSIDGTAAATQALGTASALSGGSISAVADAAGSMASRMGPAGAAISGGVIALGSFTQSAVNSLGATERLANSMGVFADSVNNINVGNLSVSLSDLALQTGSSGSAMRNAASDSFLMQTSFGTGGAEAAQYSAQILALAGRAVALNPALGETGEVAGRLSAALRSGRDKALIPYNLGITGVEIAQRAANVALEDGRTEVTQADKAMAGAALATENLGHHLQQDIAQGAQDPILQVRTLTKEFSSATSALGAPLVAPALDLLREAMPSVIAVSRVIALLAQSSLPLLSAALAVVAPVLTGFADGLDAIGPDALAVIGVVGSLAYAVKSFASAWNVMSLAMAAPTPWTLALLGIGAVVTVLGLFSGSSEQATQSTTALTDAIAEQNGRIDDNAIKLMAKDLGDLQSGLTKAGISSGTYSAAMQTASGSTKSNRTEMQSWIARQADGTATNAYFVGVLERTSPELGRMAQQLVHSGNASYDLKQKILQQALAVAEAGKQAKLNADSELALAQAMDFTKETTDAATEAAKTHKQALFDAMSATQANLLATQAQAAADANNVAVAQDQAQATRSVGAATAAVSQEHLSYTIAVDTAMGATLRYAEGQGTAKEMTDALATATGALNTQLDLLLGRFLTADQASNNFQLALIGIGEALAAEGVSFDEHTKAGLEDQNMLDDLGAKAISASAKIFETSANIGAAQQPLIDFRAAVQNLRDSMAASGGDTTFLDTMLGNIDNAIAGVGVKTPEMQAAAAKLASDGAAGGALAGADWVALGAFLGGQTPVGIDSTAPAWGAAAVNASNTGWGSALGTRGQWHATGTGLGDEGHGGVSETYGGWVAAAQRNAQGAIDETANHGSSMHGAGSGVGEQGTTGLGQGMAPAADVASAAVEAAAAAAGLAGANMHNIGLGIGMAFSEGLGDGLYANLGYVTGAADALVHQAERASRAKGETGSPSRLFARVGRDLALGLAVGITGSTRAVVRSASDQIDAVHRAMKDVSATVAMNATASLTAAGGYDASLQRNRQSLGAASSSTSRTEWNFNVQVHGVSDPKLARAAGEEFASSAAEGLTRRGIVMRARVG